MYHCTVLVISSEDFEERGGIYYYFSGEVRSFNLQFVNGFVNLNVL
jgi:hypothetical protein